MHNEGGRNRKNTEKKTGKTEVKNAGKKKKPEEKESKFFKKKHCETLPL